MCLASRPNNRSALDYLQVQLAEVVDHLHAEESAQFRTLSSWLVKPPSDIPHENSIRVLQRISEIGADVVGISRYVLFEDIRQLVSDEME